MKRFAVPRRKPDYIFVWYKEADYCPNEFEFVHQITTKLWFKEMRCKTYGEQWAHPGANKINVVDDGGVMKIQEDDPQYPNSGSFVKEIQDAYKDWLFESAVFG